MSIKPLAVTFGLSVLVLGVGFALAQSPPAGGQNQGRLAVCQKDFDTLCASVERGKGQRLQCLKDNEAKLAPECKTTLDAVLAARAACEAASGGAVKQ